MSRFSFEGKRSQSGEKLPLVKRIKKALFNAKVNLFRDAKEEVSSVRLSDRVLK